MTGRSPSGTTAEQARPLSALRTGRPPTGAGSGSRNFGRPACRATPASPTPAFTPAPTIRSRPNPLTLTNAARWHSARGDARFPGAENQAARVFARALSSYAQATRGHDRHRPQSAVRAACKPLIRFHLPPPGGLTFLQNPLRFQQSPMLPLTSPTRPTGPADGPTRSHHDDEGVPMERPNGARDAALTPTTTSPGQPRRATAMSTTANTMTATGPAGSTAATQTSLT